MNISDSLNYHLPEIKIVKPKNEVDLYGFSNYLSNKLKIGYNYSFSSWVHGWIFNELIYREQFNTDQYSPHLKIVANSSQKVFLEEQGFEKVLAAGYPYIYIDQIENIKRFKNSILIMPPKNSVDTFDKIDEDAYIDSIKDFKKDFKHLYFCIDQISFERNLWVKKLKENKINYVIGAHANDINSLLRAKTIFQHFEYVHSPVIGSALVYAAFDGCKVSLSENYIEYKVEKYKNHPFYHSNRKYVDYEIYTKSKRYIQDKFGFLFCKPSNSNILLDWARDELGLVNKVDVKEIKKILGWRYRDKIKFYPMKYYNSLARKLKK